MAVFEKLQLIVYNGSYNTNDWGSYMSFVICVCSMHFSVMMSDGRMIRLPDNAIVSENVSKVIKINNNVAMACTGDPIPIQVALNNLKEYNVNNMSMEEIEKAIIEQIKEIDSNILGIKLIFSGRDKDSNFIIHTTNSNDNFEINVTYPRSMGITYACAGNNDVFCNSVIQRNFANAKISTAEQLESLMARCIREVAQFDKTVNTNIYKVVIK